MPKTTRCVLPQNLLLNLRSCLCLTSPVVIKWKRRGNYSQFFIMWTMARRSGPVRLNVDNAIRHSLRRWSNRVLVCFRHFNHCTPLMSDLSLSPAPCHRVLLQFSRYRGNEMSQRSDRHRSGMSWLMLKLNGLSDLMFFIKKLCCRRVACVHNLQYRFITGD